MLSKIFGWVSNLTGLSSAASTSADSKASSEAVSTEPSKNPPPIPAKPISKMNVNSLAQAVEKSTGSADRVVRNGELVPKALASAFEQPRKDKKPFSYFAQGQAPDLSSHPSPRSIKKANPVLNGPAVPKVLPIVSNNELEREQQRRRTPTAVAGYSPTMPTVTHCQYNTPLALYSKDTFHDELSRATGQPSPTAGSSQFDIHKSGAYKLLNATGELSSSSPEQHRRRDESKIAETVEDYPRYRGYVNPKSQSPCFKRLQYFTGLHTDSEDEKPIESSPPLVRGEENLKPGPRLETYDVKSKAVSFGADQRQPIVLTFHSALTNSTGSETRHIYEDNVNMPTNVQNGPVFGEKRGESRERSGSPTDPRLLAKIAEAERPKLPPPVVPDWTRKAEQKHEKWRGYGEYQEQHKYVSPPTPKVIHSPVHRPKPVAQTPQPVRRELPAYGSGSYTLGPSYSSTTTTSNYAYDQQQRPQSRAKSTEPEHWRPSSRSPSRKEPWMKPYVAPNVAETKYTKPLSIRTTTTPTFKHYYSDTPSYGTTATDQQQHYYSSVSPPAATGGGTDYSKRTMTSSSSFSRRQETSRTPYKIETTYLTPLPTKYEAYKSPTPATETPWSYTRPPITGETSTSSTVKKTWQHENDAYRQQKDMEREVIKRSSSTGPSTMSPRWRPVSDRTVTKYGAEEAPTITQKWQDASGASTKSQTTGAYLDKDGNTVNYVKEVYTTSDPGKEFSMLTQEERKVLEEPLQPGVISRHITTKYYKKSTYTSSTTTSTSQTPPTMSTTYPTRFQIGGRESQY